ncbi:MAG: imidazole glycerol phosphate synthase subunit HisH [Bacteroidetes bacterium]|nr:imidazole glycerol phosphate synthase subunit HisH [Bacteroidota bacterium]
MNTITIIDYGIGNLNSVANMIRYVGGKCIISSDLDTIVKAEKLLLPGVGAFDMGMSKLTSSGIKDLLNDLVIQRGIPILGICLGMQLMTQKSAEGELEGLGWIEAEVKKFTFNGEMNLKIPHMGWNNVEVSKDNLLIKEGEHKEHRFYFVHSYFVDAKNTTDIMCLTRYGHDFCSAFSHQNIFGVQFHPEKSHKYGMSLMKKFIQI